VIGIEWPDSRERFRRMSEATKLIRRLWTEDFVEFDGEYYHVHGATVYDRPERPVPIYVAATGEVAAKFRGTGRRRASSARPGRGMELYRDRLLPAVRGGRRGGGAGTSTRSRRRSRSRSRTIPNRDRALADCRIWAALALPAEDKVGVHNPREMEERAAKVTNPESRWLVSSDPDEHVEQIAPVPGPGLHPPGPPLSRGRPGPRPAALRGADRAPRFASAGGERGPLRAAPVWVGGAGQGLRPGPSSGSGRRSTRRSGVSWRGGTPASHWARQGAGDHVLAVCGSQAAAEVARLAGAEGAAGGAAGRPETRPPGWASPTAPGRRGGRRAAPLQRPAAGHAPRPWPPCSPRPAAWAGPAVMAAPRRPAVAARNALYLCPPDAIGLHFGDDSLGRFRPRRRGAAGVRFRAARVSPPGPRPGRAVRPGRAAQPGRMSRLEVFGVEGLPEVRPGDDLGRLIADFRAPCATATWWWPRRRWSRRRRGRVRDLRLVRPGDEATAPRAASWAPIRASCRWCSTRASASCATTGLLITETRGGLRLRQRRGGPLQTCRARDMVTLLARGTATGAPPPCAIACAS